MVWNPFARAKGPAAGPPPPPPPPPLAVLSPSMPPVGIANSGQPMWTQQTSPSMPPPGAMAQPQMSPNAVPGLLPGLRPNPQAGNWQPAQGLPMVPGSAYTYMPLPQQAPPDDGMYVDIPVQLPLPPPQQAAPRAAVVTRGRSLERAAPAQPSIEPYVPPPWKTAERGGLKVSPERFVHLPQNWRGPMPSARVPAPYPAATNSSSNPFTAVEQMAHPHDKGMPPNVFQAPSKFHVPPHVRPSLAHPLSLADVPDPPHFAPG